jgi:hypothetical protein
VEEAAEQRIAWWNARATQQQGNAHLIADMRKEADSRSTRPTHGRILQTPPNRFKLVSTTSKSVAFTRRFSQGRYD